MINMIVLSLILSMFTGIILAYALYRSSISIVEAFALGLFFVISFVAIFAVILKFLIRLTTGVLWFFIVHVAILFIFVLLNRGIFKKLKILLSWRNINEKTSCHAFLPDIAFIGFLFFLSLIYVYLSIVFELMFKAGGAIYQYLALIKLTESMLGLENYHITVDAYPYAYQHDPRLGPIFVFVAILRTMFDLKIETAAIIMSILNFLLFYSSLFSFVKELRNSKSAFIVCLILLFVIPPYILFPIYSYFTFIDMLRAAMFPQFFALGVMFIGLWAELRSANVSNIEWNLFVTKIMVAFVLVISHILTFVAFVIIDFLFILEDIIKSRRKKYILTNRLLTSLLPIGIGTAFSLLWPLNNPLYLLFLTFFNINKPAGLMISEKESLLWRQKNFIGILFVSIYGLPFIITKRRNIALTLWVISFIAMSALYLGPWEQKFPLRFFVLLRFMPLIRLPLTVGIVDGLFMLSNFLDKISINGGWMRLKRYVIKVVPLVVILGIFINVSIQGYRTSYVNFVLKKKNIIPKLRPILDLYDDRGGVLLALPYVSYVAQAISNFSTLTVIKGQYGNPITAELYRNRTESLYRLFKSYDFLLWLGTILRFNITHILLERVGPYNLILMALVDQLGCRILYNGWYYKLLEVPRYPYIRNYIVNPSFEYDLIGWHYWGEGTVGISNVSVDRYHSACLEVKANGGLHIQINRYYPITAGDNIFVSLWVNVVGNISSLYVGIEFSSWDKKVIDVITQQLKVTNNNTWQKYDVVFTAPKSARGKMFFRVAISAYAGENGGKVYVDNVSCKTQTKLSLNDITYVDPRMILDTDIKKLFNELAVTHKDLAFLGVFLILIQIILLFTGIKSIKFHESHNV